MVKAKPVLILCALWGGLNSAQNFINSHKFIYGILYCTGLNHNVAISYATL